MEKFVTNFYEGANFKPAFRWKTLTILSVFILCRLLKALKLWIYAILPSMHLLVDLVQNDGVERMRSV